MWEKGVWGLIKESKLQIKTFSHANQILIYRKQMFFCDKRLNWSYLELEYFLFQIYSQKVRVRVFNAIFNNFSAISWRSILLVEKTADMSKVTDKLYNIMLYQEHYAWAKFELIGTDCIGSSCKSNCHVITTTTTPNIQWNLVILNRDTSFSLDISK